MADTTDLQRLVVSMEARYASMERELRKANGVANKQARAIETRFAKMNTSVGASLGRLGGLVAGAFSIRAAQQLIDTSTRITNSLKVAGLEGEELKRVYDRLFISAQKNAAPIEALADLYSRASLVQKELGVSTEELLKFTDQVAVALRVSGKSAAESSGALLQLSQALGSGIVRAEEFNSILEGALPIAQAAAAGLREAGGSVAKLRQLVVDGKISSEAFFRAFEAGSSILEDKVAGAELTVSQQFVRLQNVLQDAAGKIDEVAGAGTRAKSGLGAFADGIEALVSNKERLEDFVLLLERAAGAWAGAKIGGMIAGTPGAVLGGVLGAAGPDIMEVRPVVDELRLLEDTIDEIQAGVEIGLLPPEAFENASKRIEELRRQLAEMNREASLVPASSPIGLSGLPVPAGSGSGSGTSPSAITLADYPVTGDATAKAEKRREKIDDVIAALTREGAQLSRTAREQAVYNALQRAGITDTHAMAGAVRQAAELLYDNEAALKANTERMEEIRDAAKDFASTLIDGLREGKSAVEALGDAVDRLADKLLDQALTGIMNSLFQGPSVVLSGAGAPLFADGGPVRAARGGRISGPGTGRSDSIPAMLSNGEFVVNAKAARRHFPLLEALNEGRLRAFAAGGAVGRGGGGGGGPMTIAVDVSGARGNTEIEAMVAAGVRRGLGEYDRVLPDRVTGINRTPRRRG